MWDCYGLETLIDVTALEQENIISVLRGNQGRNTNPIQMMIIRAQANSQRFYEIYYFSSEISEEEILDMFQHNTQTIVDAIRRVGQNVYDGREKRQRVIT
jgi:hypothetical protein